MKVTQIKAYKSRDGCIWETEREALEQNIDDAISNAGIDSSDSYPMIVKKLKEWMKHYKSDVRYVMKNIDSIL